VSQYLVNHVIPGAFTNAADVFFRVILFKIFNRISTWQHLQSELGDLHTSTFDVLRYDEVLSRAVQRGDRIYTSAYIMPVPKFGAIHKHSNHLRLVKRMLDEDLPNRIAASSTMEGAYRLLLSYSSIGNFLAYQYLTDLNYSWLTSFSEMEFVVPGPGAIDGISKCFGDTGGMSNADIVRAVAEMADVEFEKRGLAFPTLWGRPLQLIDYQNLFCEVDKYTRMTHPLVLGPSGRQRIKRRFRRVNPSQPVLGFPTKWGLPKSQVSLGGRLIPYVFATSGGK
jgi:hypothetical protein